MALMATIRKMLAVVTASASATVLVMQIVSGAGAQAATSLAIDVGDTSGCAEVGEGNEIEIRLSIANVTELQQWEATIVYDRDTVEIVSQDTRQFIAQTPGSNTIDASEPLPDYNGRHFLGITDASAASESGSGILAIVTLKGVGKGTTAIGIPQFDFNDDGKTDEGVALTQYGGNFIGDVNGDHFFDGNVQPGYIAVGESCSAVVTESPTDPPTPAANATTPANSAGGGSDTDAPSQPGGSGGAVPTTSGEPSGSVSAGSLTPTDHASQGVESPSDGTTGTSRPGSDNGDDDNSGDNGSSFPVWLVAVLALSGLAIGGVVIVLGIGRSRA
jgi:hypothetical protein